MMFVPVTLATVTDCCCVAPASESFSSPLLANQESRIMGSIDKESDNFVDALDVPLSDAVGPQAGYTDDGMSPRDSNCSYDKGDGTEKGKNEIQYSTPGGSPLLDRSPDLPVSTGYCTPCGSPPNSRAPPGDAFHSSKAPGRSLINIGKQGCENQNSGSVPNSEIAPADSGSGVVASLASMDLGSLMPIRFAKADVTDDSYLSTPASSTSSHSGYPRQRRSSSSARFSEDLRFEEARAQEIRANALGRSLSEIATEVLKGGEGKGLSPLEDETWRKRGKHFFIFSNAGKPIYSRYGDEGKLAGLMAIMQAMLAVVQGRGDCAKTLQAGRCQIVFLLKGPIVLVGLSRVGESPSWVSKQLELIFFQILSLATGALLRVLERNPGSDVRNLVKGSQGMLESLIKGFSSNPSYLLEAFCPVRMMAELRSTAADTLDMAVKHCGAKCGILLASGQLVALAQDKNAPLHVQDLILLVNFVVSNSQYRERGGAEFSTPICMPHLHMTAFLHAYVYCMDPEAGVVVILLMTRQDTFHLGSAARVGMEKVLRDAGVLRVLRGMPGGRPGGQVQIDELPLVAGGGQASVSPLLYFVFRTKSRTCPQFVSSKPGTLLQDTSNFKHMLRSLSCVHSAMFEGRTSPSLPVHQNHWRLDDHYAIYAQVDQDWDCYLVCDALADKDVAVRICKELSKYLLAEQMRAELFINS
ncbi:unnamed protein product [Ostreobium quekettii]|uniref:Vacuolar fusion protein MON1 homolog n=1 Tax=Ostreobium quekettii TaxID=121088 RepID=A0A8S1IMD3_9CHLO|nr:unnamed protein product [Ostreobium quekettii]|eukprot:evm.model.scf_79.13 EVM.evm.TU.scf_79.13   scf_79:111222-116730(+)